jgi:hypothetical protein
MAKSSRPTAQKRAREKAQMDRQKEKERRRAETRERKASAPGRPTEGEDPDIAGIRPGPQPRSEDWLGFGEEKEEEEEATGTV